MLLAVRPSRLVLTAVLFALCGAAGAQTVTYEASELDEPPRLMNQAEIDRTVERNYPPLLRDGGVEGDVTVRLRVLSSGRIDLGSVQALSTTHDSFNDPAIRAVRQMRFAPGTLDGAPVDAFVVYTVRFDLP